MFAGADEHPASHTHEFVDAAHKRVIEKDSSPLGSDAQLDLCCDLWKLRSRILQHDQFQYGFPAGFDKHLLREIRISRLTHDDFMFARQKEDFHIVLELIDVANVLPVDPNAGRFVRFGLPDQLHFTQDLVLGDGSDTKQQAEENNAEKRSVECAIRSHDHPPVRRCSESTVDLKLTAP